jgi:hypothetical protein
MDGSAWGFLGFAFVLGAIEVGFNHRRMKRQERADEAVGDAILAMMEAKATGRMPSPEEMRQRREVKKESCESNDA